MKPTKLLLKEITLKNGVGLNELQRQGLEPFIDRIIKESRNEAIDLCANAAYGFNDFHEGAGAAQAIKQSILKLKKK